MNSINTVKSFPSVNDVVDNILSLVDKEVYETVAIIGKCDVIQDALGSLLSQPDINAGEIHIDDFGYNDLYQLLIDDYTVYAEPIFQEDKSYWTPDIDMYFVSDWASTRYIRALEDHCCQYIMFAIYGDDEFFDDIEGDGQNIGKLSNDEAQYLWDNAEFSVIYSKYDRLPEDFQQLVDLTIDWGLYW